MTFHDQMLREDSMNATVVASIETGNDKGCIVTIYNKGAVVSRAVHKPMERFNGQIRQILTMPKDAGDHQTKGKRLASGKQPS